MQRYGSPRRQFSQGQSRFQLKGASQEMTNAKFKPETMVATRAIDEWMKEAEGRKEVIEDLIVKHLQGDWGDVSSADKKENEQALQEGGRLMSSFKVNDSREKIWVITEADRSVLTVLFPSDY